MKNGFRAWLNRLKLFLVGFYLLFLILISVGSLGILLGWTVAQPLVRTLDRWIIQGVEKGRIAREQQYFRAQETAKAGNFARAEAILESLVAKLPFQSRISPEGILKIKACATLGEIYQKQGKRRLARETFQRLVSLNPGDASSHVLYAHTLLEAGEGAKAELHLVKALDINPHDASAVTSLVRFYMEMGRMKDALDAYQRYKQAFTMAEGVNENDRGLFLFDGKEEIASYTFLPVLDDKKHVYEIPIHRWAQQVKERSIDALEIRLYLPAVSRLLELDKVSLSAPKEPNTGERERLWEGRDFAGIKTSGLEIVQNEPGCFRVVSQEVRLCIPLPKSIPGENLDLAEIGIRINKNPLAEITELLEKAGQHLELQEGKAGAD